jgi:hypothetical protein
VGTGYGLIIIAGLGQLMGRIIGPGIRMSRIILNYFCVENFRQVGLAFEGPPATLLV